MKILRIAFLFCFVFVSALRADDTLERREWKIDGVTREALVHIPKTTNAAPVVFAFHGHGGTMRRAAEMFGYHKLWPEAIVVYMQGLNTPGRLTDPEGKKPGWQKEVGDQKDRDLKFFDAVLASLKKKQNVDSKRIYATGHSNGGSFTYLLWEARAKDFAAFAPSAATSGSLFPTMRGIKPTFGHPTPRNPSGAVPGPSADDIKRMKRDAFVSKPVLHVAGENDPLVKFSWQKMMIDAVRKQNQCGEGKPWAADKRCSIYESKVGAPVVTFIHPGTHKFPAEAPALIVKFFKEHSRK